MEGLLVLVVLLILVVPIGVAIWLISRAVQSGRSLEELSRRRLVEKADRLAPVEKDEAAGRGLPPGGIAGAHALGGFQGKARLMGRHGPRLSRRRGDGKAAKAYLALVHRQPHAPAQAGLRPVPVVQHRLAIHPRLKMPPARGDPQPVRLPGGESTAEFVERMVRLIRDYRKREKGLL